METPPHQNYDALLNGRRTTRSALAEIPARLGMLTVAENHHQTTPIGRYHHPHNNNNNNTHNTMNTAPQQLLIDINLPSSYLSPTPSPDELVIQQRGRRRMPVQWSPDVDSHKAETTKTTPVKQSPTRQTSIVLRSTPRKRLLLNDPMEVSLSPDKRKKDSPSAKKFRLDRPATPQMPEGSIGNTLKGLSPEQLIGVIETLIQKHPTLESEVREILPVPDLKPLEDKLSYLKKNIFKSLPTNRLTSKTDSPAYNRAATHVTAFKKTVVEQGRHLVESQHWGSVIDYVIIAWHQTKATPLWDNPPHNTPRRQCFKSLALQCMTAIKSANFSPEQCDLIYDKLSPLVSDSEDMQACLKQLETQRQKW
ncbi:unnamed protein product [Bemisia tabaci]|uniref:Tethering factor for nuclear proteasome STS1 n=1 Tax=Bemisia tabaci TaxID=7038 RepID=A0A9P0F317_BEMTA|nr:PREDICTED: tethering factor for nuclear proteasome sts1 [Bemisia tabaci]XP_018897799.1 PREDICTED: tethering factor for nuclear proteasome sts1 [Bemisia tabaci]CAH0386116.1 unnamed protein product [Bemisia tabaci]